MRVETIKDKDKALIIQAKIRANNGYCPCVPSFAHNDDTMCMCRAFREAPVGTTCHCGLYIKVEE